MAAPKTTDLIADAAEYAAEALRVYAYGPECAVGDQTAVLASAKGWDAFADALREPKADAVS